MTRSARTGAVPKQGSQPCALEHALRAGSGLSIHISMACELGDWCKVASLLPSEQLQGPMMFTCTRIHHSSMRLCIAQSVALGPVHMCGRTAACQCMAPVCQHTPKECHAPSPVCSPRQRERERERRLDERDRHGVKKSKLTRDSDRDISEKIALGQAYTGGGTGVQPPMNSSTVV